MVYSYIYLCSGTSMILFYDIQSATDISLSISVTECMAELQNVFFTEICWLPPNMLQLWVILILTYFQVQAPRTILTFCLIFNLYSMLLLHLESVVVLSP